MNNTMKRFGQAMVAGATVVAASAHAALPEGATGAFTTIQSDALSLIDLAWPVAIAVTTGFILLGLFKKGAKKAAS